MKNIKLFAEDLTHSKYIIFPRDRSGDPFLFPKAHWVFSTTTFLPNKHNLNSNTSSVQRVFLISAKLPSPIPKIFPE